jgi:hypothetical protein
MSCFGKSLLAMLFFTGTATAQDTPPKSDAPPAPARNAVATPGGSRFTMSRGNNGKRSITLQENGEKLELQETEGGKDITLRRERQVNGELKKDEYKAADLEMLKKQHPEAAELYRRLTERVAARPPVPFPNPNGFPQFAFPGAQSLPPGQGVRSLVATVKGQRVQIEDRYGTQIEIAVTRTVDGKEQTEKHSAPDIATLKKDRPELAALYGRLTGTN